MPFALNLDITNYAKNQKTSVAALKIKRQLPIWDSIQQSQMQSKPKAYIFQGNIENYLANVYNHQ